MYSSKEREREKERGGGSPRSSPLLTTLTVVWKLLSGVKVVCLALHWLLVQDRIDYKLPTICHYFSDSAPAYFSDHLIMYTPSRQLRSSADTRSLCIPHVRTKTFGQHCFSYSAPKQWNSLPSDTCYIQSSHAFKTVLKPHLHKQHDNKRFHILSSYLPPPFPPPTPPSPLIPRYIPSVH